MSRAAQAAIALKISAHNQALATLVQALPQQNPGSQAVVFDFHTFFADVLSNATASGVDTTTPCYSRPPGTGELAPGAGEALACPDPRLHVFWDAVHPTSWVHEQAGQSLAESLEGLLRSTS